MNYKHIKIFLDCVLITFIFYCHGNIRSIVLFNCCFKCWICSALIKNMYNSELQNNAHSECHRPIRTKYSAQCGITPQQPNPLTPDQELLAIHPGVALGFLQQADPVVHLLRHVCVAVDHPVGRDDHKGVGSGNTVDKGCSVSRQPCSGEGTMTGDCENQGRSSGQLGRLTCQDCLTHTRNLSGLRPECPTNKGAIHQ